MQSQFPNEKRTMSSREFLNFVIHCRYAALILKDNQGMTLSSFQRAIGLSDKEARLVLSEIADEIDGRFYLEQESKRE